MLLSQFKIKFIYKYLRISILDILQYGYCLAQTFSILTASSKAISISAADLFSLLIPSSGVKLVARADLEKIQGSYISSCLVFTVPKRGHKENYILFFKRLLLPVNFRNFG